MKWSFKIVSSPVAAHFTLAHGIPSVYVGFSFQWNRYGVQTCEAKRATEVIFGFTVHYFKTD